MKANVFFRETLKRDIETVIYNIMVNSDAICEDTTSIIALIGLYYDYKQERTIALLSDKLSDALETEEDWSESERTLHALAYLLCSLD